MSMPPDQPDNNSISGVDESIQPRQPSLREIAEAAYDEGSTSDTETTDDSVERADRGDGRDGRGRFAPKERGQDEGEAEPKAPSPEKSVEAQERPDPAAQPRDSNQLPEHWSAEFKTEIAKLPAEAKNLFLRRYGEMEADYTRKSQANAQAVQAINAISPIFNDPDIARSLQEMQYTPVQAIAEWGRFHKAAISQNPRDRASILYEFAERLGFDPAKVFATSRPPVQLTPELEQNPAVRYFADLQGRTNSDLQALRAELQSFKQAETQRLEQDAVKVTRGSIDAYADEKGPDGKPLRPYFDTVLQYIIDAFRLNPSRDLNQTYEEACWANPEVRKHMLEAERQRAGQQQSNERAKLAARSNVRGLTSPVSKPAQEHKGNGSLRDTLESSADEVGF
jgi:hypothetical protein